MMLFWLAEVLGDGQPEAHQTFDLSLHKTKMKVAIHTVLA